MERTQSNKDVSRNSHLNQQSNYVMFNATVDSHHFNWVAFSKNFDFLVSIEARQEEVSVISKYLNKRSF